MKPFAYGRDGLFLLCTFLYVLNRWGIKPLAGAGFMHDQFNDLLLIPCALPLLLWLHRKCGLRNHDRPPDASEVLFHLVIWAVLFEGVGPLWIPRVTADVGDVYAYTLGAIVALAWWNRLAWKGWIGKHQPCK